MQASAYYDKTGKVKNHIKNGDIVESEIDNTAPIISMRSRIGE